MVLETLHLLGAMGTARTEMIGTTEYLVLPVVALMEGVIHAVNAETPEYVPLSVLEKAAQSWHDCPLTVNHPLGKDGRQCSAKTPEVLEAYGIGKVLNPRIENKKLLLEAWVDKRKAKKVHPTLLTRLEENKVEEVSVGAYVTTEKGNGTFGTKKYKGTWLEAKGDHLALLPGGQGACSIEMGCGTYRAAMRVLEGSLELIQEDKSVLTIHALTTLEGESLTDRISRVSAAVSAKCNGPMVNGPYASSEAYAYAQQVFDDKVIVQKGNDSYSIPYTLEGEEVVLGEPTQVKQAWVAASEAIRTAAGARHSASDLQMLQTMHDNSVALGAKCEEPKALAKGAEVEPAVVVEPQLKAASCGCNSKKEKSHMTKEKKAELIAALVTDKHSGFTAGDEPMLEVASDARLEELRTAAEASAKKAELSEKSENDLRAATAKVTVLEGKLKTAEQKPTADEWLNAAPPEIRALIDRQKAQEQEERDTLVSKLKDLKANTEEELKAMPMSQLKMLASYAKVDAPVESFAGRGVPVPRSLGGDRTEDYAPPDPYAAGLKALQSKTVN